MKISILLLFCLFNVSVDGIGPAVVAVARAAVAVSQVAKVARVAKVAGRTSNLARASNIGRLANTGSKLGRTGNFLSRGNPFNAMKNVKTHLPKKSVSHTTRGMKNKYTSRLSNGGFNSRTSNSLSIRRPSSSITRSRTSTHQQFMRQMTSNLPGRFKHSTGRSRNPGQTRGSSFLSKSRRPTSVQKYNSRVFKSSRQSHGNQLKSRLQDKCKYTAYKPFFQVSRHLLKRQCKKLTEFKSMG